MSHRFPACPIKALGVQKTLICKVDSGSPQVIEWWCEKYCPTPNFQTLSRNPKGTEMDMREEGRKNSMICRLC